MKTAHTQRKICHTCEELIEAVKITYTTTNKIKFENANIYCSKGHVNYVMFREST